MKISKVICAPGRTGFYFDDQAAIKAGAAHKKRFESWLTDALLREGVAEPARTARAIAVRCRGPWRASARRARVLPLV